MTNQEGERVLVNLNLAGEISVEEIPLTKAFSEGDLIGIQVKQGSTYYAYGLFDNPSNISLYLNHGKRYSFECSLVKNGKTTIINTLGGLERLIVGTQTWCTLGSGYALPFIRGPQGTSGYVQTSSGKWNYAAKANLTPITNEFIYTSDSYFNRLQYGQVTNGQSSRYSNAVVYYGEASDVLAGNSISIPIDMRNCSFGIATSISGITDGDVTVTIQNSLQTFLTNSNITQDTQFETTIWSFYDLRSAWQYANNYTENFTVGVIWNRVVGVTQDLGTKTVQFKRNAVNRVNINLGASTKSANIAINVEEPEIINEAYTFGN